MRVAGLDLSITATGVAGPDGITYTIKPWQDGDARLNQIRDRVGALLNHVDLAVIEDLPTHAKGAGITGMVHGVIRSHLITWGIPYALVVPSTLKRYATGKGTAGKPEMAVAAYKRGGLEGVDDNRVDAWWLRAMGLHALGVPLFDLPARQAEALKVVDWPVRATV